MREEKDKMKEKEYENVLVIGVDEVGGKRLCWGGEWEKLVGIKS